MIVIFSLLLILRSNTLLLSLMINLYFQQSNSYFLLGLLKDFNESKRLVFLQRTTVYSM